MTKHDRILLRGAWIAAFAGSMGAYGITGWRVLVCAGGLMAIAAALEFFDRRRGG